MKELLEPDILSDEATSLLDDHVRYFYHVRVLPKRLGPEQETLCVGSGSQEELLLTRRVAKLLSRSCLGSFDMQNHTRSWKL